MPARNLRCVVAAGLCGLVAGTAWAGRPLNTDTADVIDPGVVQFETTAAHVASSGAPSSRGWNVQLSLGTGLRTQIALAESRVRADDASSSGRLLGGKTWLAELGTDSPGLSLGYGLTQARGDDHAWHHDTGYLTLVGTQPFGHGVLAHANLGWTRSALAQQSSAVWALAGEYAAAEKLSLAAETFGDTHHRPTVSGGGLWQVAEQFSVNASYGVTFARPRARQWALGFLAEF